ncbi:hypothetical protein TI39_contig486g00002 [Zymoseptoria brevis]|uniref:Uncharacterized protein n=1 Tax=Zymoseptoria brevis TaxID=1047168 RepID=A0A0F4GJ92_9PEZI|nr:hypothetical protein TI39_contig486g00002 [Zymoseptoria brevis]
MDSSVLPSKEHLHPHSTTTTTTTHMAAPVTPETSHALLPSAKQPTSSASMTPPPSTQARTSNRAKSPTPNTTVSHISTPPPTVECAPQAERMSNAIPRTLNSDELNNATPKMLRDKLVEVQAAYQEAKMTAAHYKLQHNMQLQESEAHIERLEVEARMQQSENEIIHRADRNRAAATPVQQDDLGLIQVHRDLYQRMCAEIQNLGHVNRGLEAQCQHQHRVIERQETELASLNDRVTLMRERIRESRDALRRARSEAPVEHVRRAPYTTHHPRQAMAQPPQQNPFAALVQASEMASQESARSAPGKGHKRNVHSLSSLPATPQRMMPPTHTTPHGREPPARIPATAPVSRTTAHPVNVYRQPLPVQDQTTSYSTARAQIQVDAQQSDGTVSASDNDDSEAETEILEHDDDNVNESFASIAATQMLRQEEHPEQRTSSRPSEGQMRQTTLFGAVRKNVPGRQQERPSKRAMEEDEGAGYAKGKKARVGASPVGLGIKGVAR